MFIGGLNWETTDGKRSPNSVPRELITDLFAPRIPQRLFLAVWRSHRVHSDARWRYWSIAWFRLPYLQGPKDSECCYGQGTLFRRENCEFLPQPKEKEKKKKKEAVSLARSDTMLYRLILSVPFPETSRRKRARFLLAVSARKQPMRSSKITLRNSDV